MTITSISYRVYEDDLFSDTAGTDTWASAEAYADQLEAELSEAYPNAEISVTTHRGSGGAGSYGDLLIIGDDDAEEVAARDTLEVVCNRIANSGAWLVATPAD